MENGEGKGRAFLPRDVTDVALHALGSPEVVWSRGRASDPGPWIDALALALTSSHKPGQLPYPVMASAFSVR